MIHLIKQSYKKLLTLLVGSMILANPIKVNAFISGYTPVISGDSLGNMVTVWEEFDSTLNLKTIHAASKASGGPFVSFVSAISQAGVQSMHPLVMMNNSGNSVAIWLSYDFINQVKVLYGAFLPLGGISWTVPTNISLLTDDVEEDYQLKICDDGEIAVVWHSYTTQNVYVATAIFPGAWSVPLQISN